MGYKPAKTYVHAIVRRFSFILAVCLAAGLGLLLLINGFEPTWARPSTAVAAEDSDFIAIWFDVAEDNTASVAWGDYDGDGDLDLAAGNAGQPNRVYENEGGLLQYDPAGGLGWQSVYSDTTNSVAWGDYDGDGDLDLAVGNVDQPNSV